MGQSYCMDIIADTLVLEWYVLRIRVVLLTYVVLYNNETISPCYQQTLTKLVLSIDTESKKKYFPFDMRHAGSSLKLFAEIDSCFLHVNFAGWRLFKWHASAVCV